MLRAAACTRAAAALLVSAAPEAPAALPDDAPDPPEVVAAPLPPNPVYMPPLPDAPAPAALDVLLIEVRVLVFCLVGF